MKCKHNWVKSGYGNDLICTKCGYAAMQATHSMPSSGVTQEPMLRKEIEVGLFNGSEMVKGIVYEDEFKKQLKKSMGLNLNLMQRR